MHIFLFLGFILSVLLLLFLYLLDEFKMRQRKIPREKRFDYLKRTVFLKLLISCIFLLLIARGFPFLIWNLGSKDMCQVEKIISKNYIYPLSNSDKKYYVGECTAENVKYYIVNVSKKSVLLNNIKDEAVQVVNTGKKDDPRYEIVGIYKIKKLKSNNILCSAVNDMYANIYVESITTTKDLEEKKAKKEKGEKVEETVIFQKQKIVIYAPEGSIKADYKVNKK